ALGMDQGARAPTSVSMAKQLTGAYAPLSAVAMNAEMAEAIEAESSRLPVLGHGYTYGGHPLGCAVGVKTLELYQSRDILGNVRKVAPRTSSSSRTNLFQNGLAESQFMSEQTVSLDNISVFVRRLHPSWFVLGIVAGSLLLFNWINQTSIVKCCELFDDYELTQVEKNRILLSLDSANLVDYEIDGSTILVPQSEKSRYLTVLRNDQVLPAIFEDKQEPSANFFIPKSERTRLELRRKQQSVENMILKLAFVKEVQLEIDVNTDSSFGSRTKNSAVAVITHVAQSPLNQYQIKTIRETICGAFARLQTSSVIVVDANANLSESGSNKSPNAKDSETAKWQKQRESFYIARLKQLQLEFPDLEISVEVEKVHLDSQNQIDDEIARVPAKLAGFDSNPSSTLTLNGGGTVATTTQTHKKPPVITAEFNALSDESYVSTDSNTARERIYIHVTMGIDAQKKYIGETTDMQKQKEYEFRDRIQQKVKKMLPAHLTDEQVVISIKKQVLAKSAPERLDGLKGWLQQNWTTVTLSLLGVLAIFWNRQPRQNSESTAEATQTSTEDLQAQLSNLIDEDPETAAQVIKSWIQNT
ncbi:MAG: aminotransferase class III-fold pyridoxal phosphate-dependent enzyme, partial [Planctomycetota bacterium]